MQPNQSNSMPLSVRSIGPDETATLVRLGIMFLLAIAVAMMNENFLTSFNAMNILRQASFLFILASGATIVMIAGGIDLSVGSTLSLAAALSAYTFQETELASLSILVALAVGLCVGLVNGFLVAVLKLQPFLATYGMLWIVSGISLWFMSGIPITDFSPEFRFLGRGFLFGVPASVWLMAVVVLAGWLAMRFSTFGQQVYMTGSNRTAATLSGVPVTRNLLVAYVLSGLGAALAAIVFLGRVNSADPGLGDPYLLPSIAAILVGGTSLFGGTGGLVGTAMGAIFLTMVLNAMNLLLISSVWQPFVTGVILIVAVLADAVLKHQKK